ncbi:hypothetical protein ScPMuIL_001617 [Solemya velum]
MLNLALSDILLGSIALPIKIANAALHENDFYGGDAVCKLVRFLPMFTIMSSISTMTAMALDRYRTVVHQKTINIKNLYIIIGVIWCISLATSSPQIYEYSVYEKPIEGTNSTLTVCGSHGIIEDFELVYSILVLIVAYIVPLGIIVLSYCVLFFFVWKKSNKMKHSMRNRGGTYGGRGTLSERKRRVLTMTITLTSIFAILWTPYFVTFTIEEIMDKDDTSEAGSLTYSIGETMIALSALSNPPNLGEQQQEFMHHKDDGKKLVQLRVYSAEDARGHSSRRRTLH